MLISNKVTELNNKIRQEKADMEADCELVSMKLDPIRRMRLKRINRLIIDLSSTIGELTGWVYSPKGIYQKSNYQYDPVNQEITFDVNKVVKDNRGYITSKEKTKKEFMFLIKQRALLGRLFKLEMKRASIINPVLNNGIKSMSYTRGNESTPETQPEQKDRSYLQIASDRFISQYGEEGIQRLVNLLNYLADTDSKDPVEMYNKQFFAGATGTYIDELFKWAASFTPRADFVEKAISQKKEEAEKEQGHGKGR